MSFPTKKRYALDSQDWGKAWGEQIDDVMTTQGSCWVANRKYFMEHVGLLDVINYGGFVQEVQEIGLKYWLGGGRMKVVKKTWYAHLSKRKKHYESGLYHKSYKQGRQAVRGNTYSVNHWMGNEEPNMIHPFEWLVEKFWPIPGWEPNWQDTWRLNQP